MKKIFVLLFSLILLIPIANAATDFEYIQSSDESMSSTSGTVVKKSDGTATMYLGFQVNEGDVDTFNASLTLTNLTVLNYIISDGWSGDVNVSSTNSSLVSIYLQSSTTIGTGKTMVIQINFQIIDTTADCNIAITPTSPICTYQNGIYFGSTGAQVSQSTYSSECNPVCEIKDGSYYGSAGTVVSASDYRYQCLACTTDKDAGIYYGNAGSEVTADQWEVQCGNPVCIEVDGVYYGSSGSIVTSDVYATECDTTTTTTTNPQTGDFLPYAVIITGIAVAIGVYSMTRNKSKIYDI